jgi:hypothetical protein
LILQISASHVAGMTRKCSHIQLLVEMEVSWTFSPGCPQTTIPVISASQVARITDMTHWCPPMELIIIKWEITYLVPI